MNISAKQNNPNQAAAGFPCPCCRAQIRFPFQELLMMPSIHCPQCGLELQIDLGQSAEALEDLRKYVNGMDHARQILDEGLPD
jgi:hypothetical protein